MVSFRSKEFKWAFAGSIVVVALAVLLPSITMRNYLLPDRFALARLALQAAAFPAIFLALYFNLIQFRKSMAKPELRLAFTEQGKTETSIRVSKVKYLDIDLDLWVINDGNAIAKLFQIELEIPGIYNPHYRSKEEGRTLECLPGKSSERGTEIASLCNNEKIISFVNSPVKIEDVKLGTDHRGYSDFKDFTINYRIIGDWGKPREGILKVHIEKD